MIQQEKIKLLEFLTNFMIGGTERQVVNLVRGLDRERFDLHVGCLGRSGGFLNHIEGNRIPLSEYRINSLCNHTTLREQWKFAGYLTFGEFPDNWSLVGIAVLVASGLYVATHQHLSERVLPAGS